MFGGNISTVAVYCVISLTLTAAICCYAQVFGRVTKLIDKPDRVRKLHEAETPLIGGLAVLVPSFAVSVRVRHHFTPQVLGQRLAFCLRLRLLSR